jgi:hypothetical protein
MPGAHGKPGVGASAPRTDIPFTVKGGTLYALVMGWPDRWDPRRRPSGTRAVNAFAVDSRPFGDGG